MFEKFVILCVTLLFAFSSSAIAANVKTLHIEAYYPRALNSLYLRGNDLCGLNWSKGLKMTPSTIENFQNTGVKAYVWSYDLTCDMDAVQKTSGLEVKVLVDDSHWMLGSNHHVRLSTTITNPSTASQNSSSILASSYNTDYVDNFFPWFYTSKGSLQIINHVYSQELNNFRDIIFYLPPSYNENTLKTHRNVLIMHDGQNLFDPKTSAFGTAWMCQNALDQMIIEGKSDEILVAGAYNTVDRNNEYTYIFDPSEGFGGKGDLYLDWIESTAIPLVAKNFRVSIVRESLGILGSSLGGLISCYAGWTRAKVYGKVGCMSSSFWWDDNDYQNNVIVKNDIDRSYALATFYMDSGTRGGDETCVVYTTQVYDYYQTKGFVTDKNLFKYIDQGGSHNEASWGARFYLPVQDLYPSSTV